MPKAEGVLLDTHVWLWMVNGEKMAAPARQRIESAAEAGELALSAISLWETGMLAAKGRIALEPDCMAWVDEALALTGMRIIPLTAQIAVASSFLPGGFHGDPADRIIVASAAIASATLITRDALILAYAREGHLKALAA